MKKIFIILICFIFSVGFSFGKKKTVTDPNETGYRGALPDVESEFDYKRKNTDKNVSPMFNFDTSKSLDNLKPAPIDNPKYLDIIIKKDKTSSYVNDLYEIKNLLEKFKQTIDMNDSIQVFNAQASSLIDYSVYVKDKYQYQKESSSASYKKLMALSDASRKVAILRTQAGTYSKYLSYSAEGAVFSNRNIQIQLIYLSKLVEDMIETIKNTR